MNHSGSPLLDLLKQLYAVLEKQKLALINRDVDNVLVLSDQCARLCGCINSESGQWLRSISDEYSDKNTGAEAHEKREARRLAEACKLLEVSNQHSLHQLSENCATLINHGRESAPVYRPQQSATNLYPGRTILKV